MKKRVLFKTNLLESQALKNYLDDQLKEGWVLTHVGKRILTFEKNDTTDVTYAVGIFEYMRTPGNEFKELVESFDYKYLGDRDGIVVFKSTSKDPFYSDQLVDDEFKNIKMKRHMKRQIINMCLLLILITSLPARSGGGFISDIFIYVIFFLLVFIVFKLNGDGGIVSYFKYKHTGNEKTDYRGIERRSWVNSLVFIAFLTQVLMFYFSGFKYENVSFIHYALYSWIGIVILGCFFYHNRARWLKAIEISRISIVFFVASFMLIVGNQYKPLSTTTKNFIQYYPRFDIDYHIDSTDIPFSLCDEEACELFQNDISQSVLMRKQNVQQNLGSKEYNYDYFEIQSSLFEETLINHIFTEYDYLVNDGIEQSFEDYYYKYEKYQYKNSKDTTYADLIVRKHNEVYLFSTLEYLSEEDLKIFIQDLPWKS